MFVRQKSCFDLINKDNFLTDLLTIVGRAYEEYDVNENK